MAAALSLSVRSGSECTTCSVRRHAEKPAAETGAGIDEHGQPDEESLAVRGWQRAGALARFFCPLDDGAPGMHGTYAEQTEHSEAGGHGEASRHAGHAGRAARTDHADHTGRPEHSERTENTGYTEHSKLVPRLRPDVVFAPGAGPGSKSKRAMQTVMPLVALLRRTSPTDFVTSYLKEDGAPLMQQVLAQPGTVLISWEHKVLPTLLGHVSGAPTVPQAWPEERFDLVWILDRDGDRWTFSQLPQMLLAGDSTEPIR